MEVFKEMTWVTSCWYVLGLLQIIFHIAATDNLYVETQSDWYSAMKGCGLQERQLSIARSRNLAEFSAAMSSSVGAWVGGKRVYSQWNWNDNIPLYTHYGCFSDSAVTPWMNATTQTTQYVYQCLSTCGTFSVALKFDACRCLTGVPEVSLRLSDDSCRSSCFGRLGEMCGGVATYSIYQRDRLPYILGAFPWGLTTANETSKCAYIQMLDFNVKTYTLFFDECGENPKSYKRMMCQKCDNNSQNCSIGKWMGTTTWQGAKKFCESVEMNLTTAASGTMMLSFTFAWKPFWLGLRLDIVLSWVNGAVITAGDYDTALQYVDGNCVAVVSDQSGFQKLQLENCAKSKPYFCDLDVLSSEISTESTEFLESTATSTDITSTESTEFVESTATSTDITSTESIEFLESTATSTDITSMESIDFVESLATSTDITSTETTDFVESTAISTDITSTESTEFVESPGTSTDSSSTESTAFVDSTATSTDMTSAESIESVISTATSTDITSVESTESISSTATSTDVVNHTLTTQFLGYTFTPELTEQIQSLSQIDSNTFSSQIIIYTLTTQLNEYTHSSQLTDTSISQLTGFETSISQFYTFETMSFQLIDSETYSAQIPANETSSSQLTEFETSSSQLEISSSELDEFITSSSWLFEFITSSSEFIINFGTSSSVSTELETSSSEFETSRSDLVEFETSSYQVTVATETINPTATFSETIDATPSTSSLVVTSTSSSSSVSLAMTATTLFLPTSSELHTDRSTLSSSSSAATDETTLEQIAETTTLEITFTMQSIENWISSVLPTTTINSIKQPSNSNLGQSESKYTTQSWTLSSGNPISGSTSYTTGSTMTNPPPPGSTNGQTGVNKSDVSKSDLLPIYIVMGVCLAILVVLTGVTVALFKHLRQGKTSSASSWRRSSLNSSSSFKELVSFKPEPRLRAHLDSERL